MTYDCKGANICLISTENKDLAKVNKILKKINNFKKKKKGKNL